MHTICRGEIRLFWCYYGVTYNFIQSHNHCRDIHQIFSCLFETFGSMSEIMFSSYSMSKKYFFQKLKIHECLLSFSISLFWNGWKTKVQNVRMTGIFLIYHCWFQLISIVIHIQAIFFVGAQWLSGRVLDSRPKGRVFEPHRRHRVVSLTKNINPSLVLVQPRKTRPFITERLLMGRKESNQTNKQAILDFQNSLYFQETQQTNATIGCHLWKKKNEFFIKRAVFHKKSKRRYGINLEKVTSFILEKIRISEFCLLTIIVLTTSI